MKRASASAKINLGLVVGPRREDGLHEVATVLQRIDIADRIELNDADDLRVTGFAEDTLVRRALELLAQAAGCESKWAATIEKRIPVAAGLGGGSSDAAAALALANDTLARPLPRERLHELASQLGADVPFFLTSGPQLASGAGFDLAPLELPQDYWIVLVLPNDERKKSTASVYGAFDARGGGDGFAQRRDEFLAVLANVRRASDLARLTSNDLAQSPLAGELTKVGAFAAAVSGAGPTVYGLFARERDAKSAAAVLKARGRVWMTIPAWYG